MFYNDVKLIVHFVPPPIKTLLDFTRWHYGVKEQNKTILCGKGSQYDEDADHSPFYEDGIIAIEACTPLSKKINCLVLEDSD